MRSEPYWSPVGILSKFEIVSPRDNCLSPVQGPLQSPVAASEGSRSVVAQCDLTSTLEN